MQTASGSRSSPSDYLSPNTGCSLISAVSNTLKVICGTGQLSWYILQSTIGVAYYLSPRSHISLFLNSTSVILSLSLPHIVLRRTGSECNNVCLKSLYSHYLDFNFRATTGQRMHVYFHQPTITVSLP